MMELRCWIAMCAMVGLGLVQGLGCYVDVNPRPSHIRTQPPAMMLSKSDVPESWSWADRDGKCLITGVHNQNVPHFCGSCWSFAVTGALSDRFKILDGARNPDIDLTPQVLLDCGINYGTGSCEGGSDILAYKFIHEYGITDTTCLPYAATDYSFNGELPCEDMMCRNCDRFGSCTFINGTKHHISEYGSVLGEAEMKAEIYARGPIACSLYAHSDAFENYTGGIIEDPTTYNGTTHVVVIYGWGEQEQVDELSGQISMVPFWLGKNSFGTAWGEGGLFRLLRGANTLNMEKHACAWAVPATP